MVWPISDAILEQRSDAAVMLLVFHNQNVINV